MSAIDILIVLGGNMNVGKDDKFPWLKQEKQFIKQAIDSGKKVIGICSGSQLISTVLESKAYVGKEKEIGFYPILFNDNALSMSLFSHFKNPYPVFHWHGDTFDLPKGAQLVASSEACKNQAYVLRNTVLALQFHF